MTNDKEICEFIGGPCDGERCEVRAGLRGIKVPKMLRVEEFRARTHDDFLRFVETWDGPRDSDGFPRPEIGCILYDRTEERTPDGAVIFRPHGAA